jgi:hypothetical protein
MPEEIISSAGESDFDRFIRGITDWFQGPQIDEAAIRAPLGEARGLVEQQLQQIHQQAGQVAGAFQPYTQAGQAGLAGYQRVLARPELSPAALFQIEQGQKAVQTSQAAQGMGLSGATLAELQRMGQGIAMQDVQQQLGNYLNLAKLGLGATGQQQQLGLGYQQLGLGGIESLAGLYGTEAQITGALQQADIARHSGQVSGVLGLVGQGLGALLGGG